MFYHLTTTSPDSRCPRCKYCLYSLPARGRCPECGFEFDERTWVWRPARTWRRWIWQAVILACWCVLLVGGIMQLGLALRGRAVRWPNLLQLALAAVAAPGVVYTTWRMLGADRAGRFIAISGERIEMRLDRGVECISLADVLRAEDKGGGARLILRNGRKLSLPVSFDPGVETRLIEVINEHVAHYEHRSPLSISPLT